MTLTNEVQQLNFTPAAKGVRRRKYATEQEALEAKREARRRYMQSDAGKAKKREINQRYSKSEKGKAKIRELKAKYRGKGSDEDQSPDESDIPQ